MKIAVIVGRRLILSISPVVDMIPVERCCCRCSTLSMDGGGLCSGVHLAISQSHLSRRALSKRADNYRGAHEEPWYQKSGAFIHYY